MQTDAVVIKARAFIFDLLSVSFAYPTKELYHSLLDGQYIMELEQRVALLPQSERLVDLVRQLAACRDSMHALEYNEFESGYISLFEYHKDPSALHLNAHLYSDDESQPVPVYQRLQAIYRDFGIEIMSDKSTEQPDHLSVQLEFFAYLHRLLLQDNNERELQKLETAITEFCIELEWVKNWAEELKARPIHVFYQPLAQLLLLMLDTVCVKPMNNEK